MALTRNLMCKECEYVLEPGTVLCKHISRLFVHEDGSEAKWRDAVTRMELESRIDLLAQELRILSDIVTDHGESNKDNKAIRAMANAKSAIYDQVARKLEKIIKGDYYGYYESPEKEAPQARTDGQGNDGEDDSEASVQAANQE